MNRKEAENERRLMAAWFAGGNRRPSPTGTAAEERERMIARAAGDTRRDDDKSGRK